MAETITSNGISIACETTGCADDPAVLLVMGLGAQLVYWPDRFCSALAEVGLYVIRYDNRDAGCSTQFDHGPPYTIWDMAADGVGLLDALGIRAAHVVGASMGGMIAQHMAIAYPERVLSLCSIMSSPTGVLAEDPPTEEAQATLVRPAPRTRDEAVAAALADAAVIGSPGFPSDGGWIRARALRHFERGLNPRGIARQFKATIAAGDWRPALGQLDLPVVVIHGAADPLIRPSWGRATATAIPGAELVLIEGMGHDLPEGAWPDLLAAIGRVIERSKTLQDQGSVDRSRGFELSSNRHGPEHIR